MLTEDVEGAGGGDGGEVDEGGAEVEAPGLVEEALRGGVVDAGAEEVGEERGQEEQVEEDDVSVSRIWLLRETRLLPGLGIAMGRAPPPRGREADERAER